MDLWGDNFSNRENNRQKSWLSEKKTVTLQMEGLLPPIVRAMRCAERDATNKKTESHQ